MMRTLLLASNYVFLCGNEVQVFLKKENITHS